jgi:hypothetical protein
MLCTRWFKYDRDYLCVNKSQFVPVIFELPCTTALVSALQCDSLVTISKANTKVNYDLSEVSNRHAGYLLVTSDIK